jgi:hypothetical protein
MFRPARWRLSRPALSPQANLGTVCNDRSVLLLSNKSEDFE